MGVYDTLPPSSLPLSVSALAFDQYGQLSEQLEQESAMRERAETLATQVCVYVCIQTTHSLCTMKEACTEHETMQYYITS